MDPSRALLRCLEQLTLASRGCLRQRSSHVLRHAKRQRITSSRTFCTSSPYHQEEATSKPRNANQATIGTMQKATESVEKMPQNPLGQLASPSSPSRPAPRAATSPRPAPANDLRLLENLDRLLQEKTGQVAPRYNANAYGRGSSLFNRTTRAPTKPAPSTNNLNVAELVGQRLAADPAGMKDLQPIERKLRLKPTLGRSIEVNLDKNMDLTRAFVSLEQKINTRGNAVKKDARMQKFHVRRGQAKKMKRRERWRIMFKQGYLAECERVRKMVKQGW